MIFNIDAAGDITSCVVDNTAMTPLSMCTNMGCNYDATLEGQKCVCPLLPASCPAGQYIQGIDFSADPPTILCATVSLSCPPGQYLEAVSPSGTPYCASVVSSTTCTYSGTSTTGTGGAASPTGCYCNNTGETWNGTSNTCGTTTTTTITTACSPVGSEYDWTGSQWTSVNSPTWSYTDAGYTISSPPDATKFGWPANTTATITIGSNGLHEIPGSFTAGPPYPHGAVMTRITCMATASTSTGIFKLVSGGRCDQFSPNWTKNSNVPQVSAPGNFVTPADGSICTAGDLYIKDLTISDPGCASLDSISWQTCDPINGTGPMTGTTWAPYNYCGFIFGGGSAIPGCGSVTTPCKVGDICTLSSAGDSTCNGWLRITGKICQ